MKNNKGITLTSLVIYIAVVILVVAILMRITTHFRNNMVDVADVTFETEFNKINLYLLDESKQDRNKIQEITNSSQVQFANGNKYTYNINEKIIYLNDSIKVCENVLSCIFSKKTAENGKSVLELTITIGTTTKTVDYVMKSEDVPNSEVNIDDYLIGASKVTYYLKSGDYVDYTPDTGVYKVADGEYGSGYTTTKGYQEFTTETGTNALKWRVLSIDEQTGEIELVSQAAAQVATPLYLQGADGYNHGVDILNDLCEALYSKTVNGKKVAVGRSINVDDINAKTTYNPKTDANYSSEYGTEYRFNTRNYSSGSRSYPNICEKEDGFYIGGVKQKEGIGGSVGLDDGVETDGLTSYSSVTGFINDWDSETGKTKKDVSVTYTFYNYKIDSNTYLNKNLGINTVPIDLLKLEEKYWVASRCINADSSYAHFRIFVITTDDVITSESLFSSSRGTTGYSYGVRPVVTLDATQLLDFTVGDGSEANPWGMK